MIGGGCGRRACLPAASRQARCVPQVLLRDELTARLGSRAALDRALADGSWRRVLRGAYAPEVASDDLALRATAVQRLLPADSWVADRCLLWLLGVDVLPPGAARLEVVVPRGAVVPRRGGVRAREAAVPPADRWVLQPSGVRCLRTARAVADLLRLLSRTEAVVVADAVQHAGLVTAGQLEAELAAQRGLRFVRLAGERLALSDARAESPPETRLRLALVDAGLSPVVQHDVVGSGGRWLARVDLAFPVQRVAVEYDGRAVHERPDVFTRDRQRQNALVGAGWTVLRYTAADLRYPPRVVAEVVACLSRAA